MGTPPPGSSGWSRTPSPPPETAAYVSRAVLFLGRVANPEDWPTQCQISNPANTQYLRK